MSLHPLQGLLRRSRAASGLVCASRTRCVCVFFWSLREGRSRPSDHLRTHSFLQGVPGAYSEQASLLAYDSCTPSPFDQFEHAFEARFAWVLESLHSLPDL